jgi:hypothetical protein
MKKTLLILTCMLFLSSGCDEDELVRLDCSPGATRLCDENGDVVSDNLSSYHRDGLCTYGKQYCTYQGWGACEGAMGPTGEVCDGLDNDCDGQIDESFPEAAQLCGMQDNIEYGVGICSPGVWMCTDGYLSCDGHVGPGAEVCDSVDNDCNGIVDDQLPNATMEVCYDGPQATILVGECKPGIRYCVDGSMESECVGQVLPSGELCDGKDNNCNGEIDEGFDTASVDLVFIVDVSGSFSDEIERTIYGIAPLLEDDITLNFRFSLVVIGSRTQQGEPYFDGAMQVVTDFVPRDEFLQYLESALIMARTLSGGREPSWDAIRYIVENTFELSFREDSNKVIILMTDETGQTHDPNQRVPELGVAAIVANSPFIVHVYAESGHYGSFDDIFRNRNNFHALENHPTTNEVFESLRRIFLNICTGG